MLQVWMTKPGLDPGVQAHELIKEINAFDQEGQGNSLIIASGGDGTVGAVASALRGTDIPLGIIPRGTAPTVPSPPEAMISELPWPS